MEKKENQLNNKDAAERPEPRPNRDKYASMWAEDNPDVDFEDKEARYERMGKDREELRNLRSSGKKLSSVLNKNRWLGAMLSDGEENPLVWLSKNGIDIRSALDDPKVLENVADAFDEWKKRKAEGEAAEKAKDDAIIKSLDQLRSIQNELGLSDEQVDRIFNYFWDEVWLPAWSGNVSKDTWLAITHAMNYDQDIANAREEAAMQARNEKHTNRLKTFDESQVPPSFSQGGRQNAAPKKKKSSMSMDFDDMKKWGY